MFWGSVKGTGYPFHSPVSPSLPLPHITICHHISTGLYYLHHTSKTVYFHSHTQLLIEHYRFADSIFSLCTLKAKYFVDQMRVRRMTSVWEVRWWGIALTTWMRSLLPPNSPKMKYDGFTEHSSRSAPVEPSMNSLSKIYMPNFFHLEVSAVTVTWFRW